MLSKKGSIKKIVIKYIIVFCLVIFTFLFTVKKIVGPSWPKINNSSKLLEDCNSLLTDEPGPIRDVNDWPESIKNLHPRFVFAGPDMVNIIISTGGISYIQWGYIIYPDKRTKPNVPKDWIIKGTGKPGIFKYEVDIGNP
ncbi:MAG: hypothetical protein JXA96_05585 [Sedimentisphaerales bacterium]|nr:hypothetical protein [Sedimentisphaerales bacterium]